MKETHTKKFLYNIENFTYENKENDLKAMKSKDSRDTKLKEKFIPNFESISEEKYE